MNTLQILSFVGFTLLVAVITWWKLRKEDTGSQQGYFLAGRSLKAPVIAASLMLTNLSTEQLVGLTGQAYRSGMSVMAWEVISAIPLIFLALIFLPRYLQRGIATIPDFIEERYDKTTRIIIDCCFLIATGICFLPIILYSGALAFNSMFHVTETFGISQHTAIWLMAVVLGISGILYAVVGGMRAIAIADVINGIGLVIGGLMVPLFGLMAMGKGSLSEGITRLTQDHSQMLNSIGGSHDPVPIGAALTGLILVNTFYWCTNQGIVQRTLASKSLSEGQKGALLTAVLKMLDPLILVLPGVIAFHLFQDLPKADMAYPALVTIVIMGFFFPRIPALAAKVAMGLGIVSYITINYLVKFDFHFLYVLACTFCINVAVMLVIGAIKPRATPFKFHDAFAVDMKPWKNVKIASVGVLFAMIGVYSGLAQFGGYNSRWLTILSYAITVAVAIYLIYSSWQTRRNATAQCVHDAKDEA
ncbi:solute:sodium symporter family transporter [Citrobacter freundii]|uniref:solute:sodium symporter family transporter n=1 Tax=Citrobacter freundii TaxID=546 RepID=UPI002B2557CF|nr:solute:sodium symporter family transporter [Citrobacter freundii]MEB2477330.1 solute:sodium symporter family transporter [Citrobacter freundii]